MSVTQSRNVFWTPDEDAILFAMWERGATGPEIGRRLDRRVSCVYNRLNRTGRIGQRNRPWTVPERNRLIAAAKAGTSYREIAQWFGRSEGACRTEGRACGIRKMADQKVLSRAQWRIVDANVDQLIEHLSQRFGVAGYRIASRIRRSSEGYTARQRTRKNAESAAA